MCYVSKGNIYLKIRDDDALDGEGATFAGKALDKLFS